MLTIEKFSQFETLRQICGGSDQVDAFMMFDREMRRFQAGARNEAAAALSICAKADSVLDRLQLTAETLSDTQLRDQRSARRWSDAGLKTIAAELVYLANIRGRLGTELLSIEVAGTAETGLVLVIDQMLTASLPDRAPLIRLWAYTADDELEEREVFVDLENHPATTASRDTYTMKRHRVGVPIPAIPELRAETKLLTISVEGRDARMRTVSLEDRTSLPEELTIRFAVYRTIAAVDLVAYSNI